MSIINNAILSIQVGVEDYLSKDGRRKYSAVRNIYAGLLLLYKEKLKQLSPKNDKELLIKARLKPIPNKGGEVDFIGLGKKTVDIRQIKDRFKDFGVTVDWKKFDRIKELRNDLEHYYTEEAPEAVLEILAKSCVLIQEFVSGELSKEPKILLGNECWQSLLDIEEVYDSYKKECMSTLDELIWPYEVVRRSLTDLECPNCSSELIKFKGPETEYPNIDLICHSCEKLFQYQDIMIEHLNKIYFADSYIAATQGGEYPIEECVQCGFDTFIIEDNLCVNCGYQHKYAKCVECGSDMGLIAEGIMQPKICDHCEYIESMMYKD